MPWRRTTRGRSERNTGLGAGRGVVRVGLFRLAYTFFSEEWYLSRLPN